MLYIRINAKNKVHSFKQMIDYSLHLTWAKISAQSERGMRKMFQIRILIAL